VKAAVQDAWARLRANKREARLVVLLLTVTFWLYTAIYQEGLRTNAYPHGDGHYSWMYARSLVFDHDVDLKNDYELCGNMAKVGVVKQTGRYGNPFYLGPALVWTPMLFVVRAVSPMAPSTPKEILNGCRGPLTERTGLACTVFSVLVVWLSYRAARRVSSVEGAMGGALVVAFGSTLVGYGTTAWFYSHMWGALGVALAVVTWLRAREAPKSLGRWLLYGASVGFAALMRPQEMVWGILAAATLAGHARAALQDRHARTTALKIALGSALGFIVLYAAQLVVSQKIYGRALYLPQGSLYVQPWHAHPFLMLFAEPSGFFSWTPLMWLGVLGLFVMALRGDTRALALPLVLGVALEIWGTSSALSWGGGVSFGARTLTSIVPIMGVGAAVALDAVRTFVFRRRFRAQAWFVVLFLTPLLLLTSGLVFSGEGSYPHFGKGLESISERVRSYAGDPFTLPATGVFAARYGARPRDFQRVAVQGMFIHDFRSGDVAAQREEQVSFLFPPAEGFLPLTPGRFNDGAAIGPDAETRFLVTLYWPWITDLKIYVRVPEASQVTMEVCGFLRCKTAAVFDAPKGHHLLEVPVAEGVFDSGINEVRLRATGTGVIQFWRWVDRVDRDPGILDR
jgi:hypothetical protein